MSWATIGRDQSEDVQLNEKVRSEEAILHDLRSSYSQALQSLSRSGCVDDDAWRAGVTGLESIGIECSAALEGCPTSRAAIVEISYLANRNRIECIAKQKHVPLAAAYKLSLDTLQFMVELQKSDILLVLQTARYAREMKDIWTYKQLMLHYSAQLPYLYRDLVLDDFAAAMQEEETLIIRHPPALHLDSLMKKELAEKDVSGWRLRESAAPAFLRFVLDKVRTGRDKTCAQLLEGWQEAWIAAAEDEEGGAMSVDDAGSASPRAVTASPVLAMAVDPAEEEPAPPPQLVAQDVPAPVEEGVSAPVSAALVVDTSAPPGKAGDDAPEASGRRSKRARNPTLAAVEAIAAAIPEGRRRGGGAGAAGGEDAPGTGAPAAVLPAARASSADCASDIFAALKKLFAEDAALFGDWRPDVTATAIADIAQRQAAALREAFRLPDAVLALSSGDTAAERAGCALEKTSSPARLVGVSSPLGPGQGAACGLTYTEVAAPVFSAFCALLGAGDSGLAERMILYAKVVEALAAPRHWPLLHGQQGLDEVVLRCWRRLTAIHPGGAHALLARLTADEELVLLESAVSYTTAREERSESADSELWSSARELTLSILSGSCAGPGQGLVHSTSRGSFWTRFVGQSELRARALWVAVVASRQIAVADLPADSTREVLTTLVAVLGDSAIALPHVASHRWNRIHRKGCDELLNALKHEGETADLIRRCAASSAWVTKALALVRTDGQLRTMLSMRSEAASGQSSSSAGSVRSPQTPCLPALLLQTCKKLDDPTVSLRTVTSLLDEAAQLLPRRVDFADGADADLQWLRDLFEHVVANWVAVPAGPANEERSSLQEQVVRQTCAILLATVSVAQVQPVAEAIALRCMELAQLLCGSPNARDLFQYAAVHAVLVMGEGTSVCTTSPVLRGLWGFLSRELEDGRLEALSDLTGDAWAQLVKLAVAAWQGLEADHGAAEVLGQLFAFVLHLGAKAGNHLSRRALGELLLLLHRALRQQAERAALRSAGTKLGKRSTHSAHGPISSTTLLREKQQRTLLAKQLTAALEGLVMHKDFSTEFPQREQRPLVVTLGQLYYASYGFLLFFGDEGSDDEDAAATDFTAPVLLQLYAFTQLCMERGWANKAEIRTAMLQLSRAPVLRACLSAYGRPLTTTMLFATTDALELLRDLDRSARTAQAAPDSTGLLTVASEIFHALLALGVTAADLEIQDDTEETATSPDGAGAYAAGLLMTTLRKECDWGDCFADQRAAFVVDSCLRDLCVNPLRWSSWQQLLGQVMESFNALCDELQKEVILTSLPVQCFEFCSDLHSVLLPRSEADGASLQVCVWTSTAAVTRATAAEFIEHIIASLESAVGNPIQDIFAPALARETISTRQGNAVSDSLYAAHLRRLAVLLALRNATLALVLRMNDLLQRARDAAVMAPDEDDDGDEAQQSAEQLSLVLSNAAKALPKSCSQRTPLQEQIAQCLARDWYFGDDLYALSTASRVVWSRAVAPLASIAPEGADTAARNRVVFLKVCSTASEALVLCVRAATALRSEIAARGALSKPTRIVITYQLCTVCLKACLLLLQHFSSAILLPAAHMLLNQVLECLGILFKGHRRLASLADSGDCYDVERGETSDLSDPERATLSKIWCALSVGVHGLKECRKLDAFDFRSVYRVSSIISALGTLLSARPEVAPPQCVLDDLRGMGVSQLDDACALRELSKLFDRKRPQIVAMWCVESAATAFEKKLVRISQFDVLRKKYIDQYLHLAAQCGEVEVVLDVLAFALAAAKHATAVVVHVLHAGIRTLHRTVRAVLQFLNEDDSVEQAASKRTALIGGATRVLQMAYELHCQLQGKLSSEAQTALTETLALLYPHSALYTPVVSPVLPPQDQVPAEAIATESQAAQPDAMNITSSSDDGANPLVGADVREPEAEQSKPQSSDQEPPVSTAALAACALKWAAYAKQLPRTEIGRRAKGYFQLLAAPERAQSSSSSGLANLAASTDAAEGETAVTMVMEPEAALIEGAGKIAREDGAVPDRQEPAGETGVAVTEVALKATADELPESSHGCDQGGCEDGEPVLKAPRLGRTSSHRSSTIAGMVDRVLIDRFIEDGVIVIPNILDDAEVAAALASFKQSLQEKGCDCTNLDTTARSLGSLSSTYGAGGILDIFYEDWKLQLNEHPSVVSAIQSLWAATYATHTAENPSAEYSHPYGPFDPHQGYMYIDRVCYRIPSDISAQLGTSKKKHLQRSLTPHLDCCPHDMYGKDSKWRPVQAFLCLTDTLLLEQGGFEAFPGHHKGFAEWAANRLASPGTSAPPCVGDFTPIRPVEDRAVLEGVRHIPCKAGDLVCWDYRIPHANARFNHATEARAVVYIGLLPAVQINQRYATEQLRRYRLGQVPSDQWHESSAPQPCDYGFSDLGQRLMGIVPWEGESVPTS